MIVYLGIRRSMPFVPSKPTPICLSVTGSVDEATWAALEVLDEWGTDTNGNGTIDPNEITLTCA